MTLFTIIGFSMFNHKSVDEDAVEYAGFANSTESVKKTILEDLHFKTPWLFGILEDRAKYFCLKIRQEVNNGIKVNAQVSVYKVYGEIETEVKTSVWCDAIDPKSLVLECFKDQKVAILKGRVKMMLNNLVISCVHLFPYISTMICGYYLSEFFTANLLEFNYSLFFARITGVLLTLGFTPIIWMAINNVFGREKKHRLLEKLASNSFSLETKYIRFNKLPCLYEAFSSLEKLGLDPKVKITIESKKKIITVKLVAQFIE
jgi:hypothetical protein